jgi:hypothetical protein
MATFVLNLFDFFCLSSFKLLDSFDGKRGPSGGGLGLRSSVSARLFAQSKLALQLRTAKP